MTPRELLYRYTQHLGICILSVAVALAPMTPKKVIRLRRARLSGHALLYGAQPATPRHLSYAGAQGTLATVDHFRVVVSAPTLSAHCVWNISGLGNSRSTFCFMDVSRDSQARFVQIVDFLSSGSLEAQATFRLLDWLASLGPVSLGLLIHGLRVLAASRLDLAFWGSSPDSWHSVAEIVDFGDFVVWAARRLDFSIWGISCDCRTRCI